MLGQYGDFGQTLGALASISSAANGVRVRRPRRWFETALKSLFKVHKVPVFLAGNEANVPALEVTRAPPPPPTPHS